MCLTLLSITQLISSRSKSTGQIQYGTRRKFTLSAVFLLLVSFAVLAEEEEWVLSGTVISDLSSHAMFVDAEGKELLVSLGNEIQGCELINVTHKSVKIKCLDQIFDVALRTSLGNLAKQVQNNSVTTQNKIITLPKQELAEYVKQSQKFVSEIAFLPVMQEQKLKGYEVSKIRPNTFAFSFGLYNGDIVTAINGVSVSEVSEFFHMLDQLADAPQVLIQVERYGQTVGVTYLIE